MTTTKPLDNLDELLFEYLYNTLPRKVNRVQDDVYILAGVLGGVDLLLIIVIIVLLYFTWQIKKQIREAEIQKKVEEEMNAQKFAAYTGEELHRKLLAVSTPAVPLNNQPRALPPSVAGAAPDSEYAFNAPYVDNRVLPPSQQNGRPAGNPTPAPRFTRF